MSPEHRLRRAPRVRAWLIVALLAPAVQAQDVDEAARIDAREDIIPVVRVRADRGPIDHLGWGTSEDLYVDLGAGAAVSVFSGNAVVHVPTFVRADLPADGRMALTYNHLDSGGSPELAPGWSWDLGRAVVPGAWGDRVLVDADGFRDSFFAGPPPSEAEAAELAEQVVRSWRRDTPPRQRRAAGGEAALRDLLASDPLFFGEMRARFLGAPPDPDPDAVWRSDQRGHRLLVRSEDRREQVLTRHDGGTEVYADAGHLLRVEPAVGLPLQLDRENGRLVGIDIDGRREVHVQRDSYDRVVGLRSAQGEDVDLRYVGPALHRVDTPRGAVRLTYDRAGRLVSMQGPDGGIDLTYDDRSGRLLRASGPRGRVTLGDLQGQEARLAVRAEVDGVAFDVAWDAERRTRTVTSGDSVQRVRFDELGLPRAVDDDDGSWTFDWDRGGRLLSAAAGDAVVRWERRDRGALAAVIDVGGQRAAVRLDGGSRVAGWSEPEGHRTDVTLDSAGRPQRLEHPGGRLEQVWRDRSGLLKGAEISGSGGVTLRRDRRGLLRAAESATGASVAVELDAAGRVARFEPPGGGRIELQHDAGGRLTRLLDGGTEVLLRSQDGWLAGWRGGHEDVAFDRAEDGRVTAVRSPAGAWSIQRSGARLDGLTFGGELRLDRDAAGRLTGWSRGTDGLRLDRDSDGLVVGWGTPAQGDVARRLDRGGRPVEISLPGARWLLSRDRSGRVRTVEAPAGGTWRLDRDDAGRIALIAGPRELRWRLERDAAGRLVGLRADGGTWSVRRDRAGRITDLTDPDGRGAVVILDRAGRWTELQPLGLRPIAANYSASGPTAVGDARRSYDPQGAVSGWGPSAPVGEWFVDRQADGLVATVGWRRGRSVDAQGAELRRRISRSGDVVRSGPWTLSGRDGRLDAVELAAGEDTSLRWAVRRDAAGRSEELEVPGGIAAAVSFGPAGDARSLRLDDVDWSFERDALGRVTSIGRGAARWSLVRDPLGRASAWTLLEPGGDAVDVRFDPLDGSRGGDTTIAEALGVQTDAPAGDERPSGSVRVEVDVAGGRLLAFDEVRSPLGRLAGVEGFWGTTGGDAPGELDVSVDPTLRAGGGLEPAADAIGDVLAELLAPGGADALVPRWGGEALRSSSGATLLPSPTGRGAGAAVRSGSGHVRLAADDGGTVTWIGRGGVIDGLRLPSPSGRWVTPTGWLGRPTPGGGDDPEVRGPSEPPPSGPAAAVEAWWSGFEVGADDLAVLPPALAVGARAWSRPRLDRMASAADLPALEAPTDAGAALPPVPGVDRLLPGRRGGRTVGVLEALALSGDLPADSADHRGWLDPPAEWSLWLPGATILRAVADRRASPSSPPRASIAGVAGASPALDGLLTDAGRAWEADVAHDGPELAVTGLPAGTPPLRPGRLGRSPGARETIPGQARAAALHALSDDPLLPGAWAREAARSDGVVLAAHALGGSGRPATSPWLGPPDGQAWVVQTPGGVRAVLDGRGHLLSLSVRSRENEAWRRLATAHAGRSVLHPGQPLDDVRALVAPRFLPEPSDRPESRWGLVPADPQRPLTALGAPALPALIGVRDPSLGPLDVWRLLPAAASPP